MKLNTKASVDKTGNRYCGPMVIAALLGCSTAEAAAKVRQATGTDRAIKGMYNTEMFKTLAANGLKMTEEEVPTSLIEDRQIGHPRGIVSHTYSGWHVKENGRMVQRDYVPTQYCALKSVKLTLAGWAKQRKSKSATYLVNVTGHYVLVSGRGFIDTFTKGVWVPLTKAPRRRKRVQHVWMIEKA